MVCVFPLDVDECVFSPSVCPQNTECHNTPGSFTCTGNQHQTFVTLLTQGHTAWAHHIVYAHKTSFVSVAYIHTNMMSNMHGVTGHSQKSETECSRYFDSFVWHVMVLIWHSVPVCYALWQSLTWHLYRPLQWQRRWWQCWVGWLWCCSHWCATGG